MEISKILEGWRNTLVPREELKEVIEKVYEDRVVICDTCDEDSENKKKTGWTTLRMDRHCTNCGCTTAAKLRCLSCECPLKKWLSVTTSDNEYKLKTNVK